MMALICWCLQVTLVLKEASWWKSDNFVVLDVLGNKMFKLSASQLRLDQKRSLLDVRTGQVRREVGRMAS